MAPWCTQEHPGSLPQTGFTLLTLVKMSPVIRLSEQGGIENEKASSFFSLSFAFCVWSWFFRFALFLCLLLSFVFVFFAWFVFLLREFGYPFLLSFLSLFSLTLSHHFAERMARGWVGPSGEAFFARTARADSSRST